MYPLSKRCGAEFFGTFWLVFGGCGSAVLAAQFGGDGNPLGIGLVGGLFPALRAARLPVTEALWAAGIVPHYNANITGHGWRKLLRHPKALTYRITALPEKTPVLAFMRKECGLDDHEAYGTLNMGAGFALYVAADQAERVVAVAQSLGIPALVAGRVEEGPKQVVIEPLGVTYGADELQLR